MPARPDSRVTLATVAQAAGVSVTGVSMALRNHPRIGAATRRRVQVLAKKLGYRPDPQLSKLMLHLRTRSVVNYVETIAYLADFARHEDWCELSQYDYFLGARERAEGLGYRLELFHLRAPSLPPRTLNRVLRFRGIRGVLVGGMERDHTPLQLKWENFYSVTFGYSLTAPAIDRVSTDYYRAMLTTAERLSAEGCTRIGLNLSINDDLKALRLWQSGYLLFQHDLPPKNRVPMNASPGGSRDLAGWQQAHSPDAIISVGCDFPQLYEGQTGRPPPRHIRYVNMNIQHADPRSRGIDQDSFLVGAHGCAHLVAHLHRNETGLPAHPQVNLVEGRWVDDWGKWASAHRRRIDRERTRAALSG